MALRKPLVMVAGQIQQLQAGDMLDATIVEQEQIDMTATANLVIGNAVYVDGDDSVDLAKADAAGTTEVLGLCVDLTVDSAATGSIATDGAVLTATIGQWDVVAGTTGGLTAGAQYYLSDADVGELTETAPTTAGKLVIPVGVGLSATKMKIDIGHSTLL